MHRLKLKGATAHALFHVCQRVDTLLKELEFLDLHRVSVACVNELFTHGLNPSCQDHELEQALQAILADLPAHAANQPEVLEWEARYRTGLEMELTGLLHQGLGLIMAYRTLPVESEPPNLAYVETAEGRLGQDPYELPWLERACDWQPGTGPWG